LVFTSSQPEEKTKETANPTLKGVKKSQPKETWVAGAESKINIGV
jgi:hypothetical protein